MPPRYDAAASWYDAYVRTGPGRPFALAADRLLARLLGPGGGRRCLDLGCGGGAHAAALARLGWQAAGVDISTHQVAVARRAGLAAVAGSAAALPLASRSLDAVATILTTTDFDELPPVFAEARRVLRPGGRLVVIGTHPCFGGVHIERGADGSVTVRPGYRRHERIEAHPLLGHGIRRRVGTVNVPLPAVLNALAGSGLLLEQAAEDDTEHPVPYLLGLAAVRPLC
jgi:SAM-dependent methyltransferase